MMRQNDESTQENRVLKAAPVTPSATSHRPEGLAFDIEDDADLQGVPVGDQRPVNPDAEKIERQVRESGHGVGLTVPTDQGPSPEPTAGE